MTGWCELQMKHKLQRQVRVVVLAQTLETRRSTVARHADLLWTDT